MAYIVFDFYKKNCGSYNKIFAKMKSLYIITQAVPIIVIILSVILTLIFMQSWFLIIGGASATLLMIILISYFNRKARKIAVERNYSKEYKGHWNNLKVLEKLKEDDKKDILIILKDKNKYDVPNITRLLKEIDEMLLIYKPKFPVIPAIFGGLLIAWYSAYVSWLFDKTSSLDMMNYPISMSLSVLIMFFLLYKTFSTIVNVLNEMFFSKDFDSLSRMRKIVDEIHFEVINS